MTSIIELPETVNALEPEEKKLFFRFFNVHRSIGRAVLPSEMKPWADKTFGSAESVEEQKIIKVFDKHLYEAALFNELRAKRPMQAKEKRLDFRKVVEESAHGPFSTPLSMTPEDVFGRVKGKHCISASNISKYDGMHGLIIFNKHNPLDFNEKEVQDYFRTALKWFDKAHKSNKKAVYPFILWNCLWRAAASIIHGHMQVVLGEGLHYGEAENDNKARREYYNRYKRDYFSDYYKAHQLVGLGLEHKGVKVFASLVPRKDKEITIISKKLDEKCVKAIYLVMDCFKKDLGVMSFNLSVVLPPLAPAPRQPQSGEESAKASDWKDFPVIIRVIDRGSLSNKTTDVGGMEIYDMANVIPSDPYKVFNRVKARF